MKTLIVLFSVIVVVKCRKNVLFIIADDMRPNVHAYNGTGILSADHAPMFTPNIDKLASRSLLVKRAYVQQALCSPSRTSFLTGRRPDTTHVYDLDSYFRTVGGNYVTIPQYFKNHGYESVGIGKIFHPGTASHNNDPISWTLPYFRGNAYWEDNNHTNSWKGIPDSLLKDKPLQDQQIATHAISQLRQLSAKAKSGEKPFFIAVGFHRPHLPFIFPQSAIQHYPWRNIHVPNNQYAPQHLPPIAWSKYNELRAFQDIASNATGAIGSVLPRAEVIQLRRAYYASITFIDSLVGLLMNELASLGLDSNTVVSFIGDHGYQLGEHGEWCKHTNFEVATHAPMMVRVPGMTDHGIVTEQLTEFVDLFPTLVEAAGMPQLSLCPEDSTQVQLCREGMSMIPLMKQPNTALKNASFSQYPRRRSHHTVMGYTMRTNRYRYTEWVSFNNKPTYKPDWNHVYARELYDHKTDPDENINKADYSTMSNIRQQLSLQLRAGWRNNHANGNVPQIFGR